MERWSAGHWHNHAYCGYIDSRLIEKIGGAAEYPDIVLVKAEHNAKVDSDSVTMQARDEPAIVSDSVVSLVRGLKTLLRDRLETHKERLASAPCGQLHEFIVANGIGRALARPPFSQRSKSPEEFLRVARISTDVIVPEDDRACRTRRDFTHNLINWTVPDRARTVEKRDCAVIAAVRTSACCNRDGFPVPASLDQVPPWCGHASERGLSRGDVDTLQLASASIIEDARPCIFGLACDDCIRMT